MAFSFSQLSQTIYMPAKLKPLANLMAAQAEGFRKTICIRTVADAIAAIAPNTRTCPTFAKIFGTIIEPIKIPANQPDITILVAKLLKPTSGARVPSKTTCKPLPALISNRPKKRVQVDMIALSITPASHMEHIDLTIP